MAEPELSVCETCPAYLPVVNEGAAGVCRRNPPVVFQNPEYFRGSTRSMLFGAFPAVGTFPLVKRGDWCMEHPANRDFWAKGIKAALPPAGTDEDNNIDDELKEHSRKPEPPPGSSML
jgi:hypothetical protein